jgi:hypothetical protein
VLGIGENNLEEEKELLEDYLYNKQSLVIFIDLELRNR